jgi:hypothetical protein
MSVTAEADLLAKAAADKPPQPGSTRAGTVRSVLKPGSVYRIEVSGFYSTIIAKPLTTAKRAS